MSGFIILEGEAPTFGLDAFNSRPMVPSSLWLESGGEQYTWTDIWFTNHIVQAIIATAVVIGLWLILSHKPKVVPSKRQWSGEYLYNVVRNGIARDILGEHYLKYVPWLLTLFTFILVNNLFGEFFVFMFPTFSKIGFAWGLAILSWVLYNAVGIKNHGFIGYFKKMTIPAGVPKPLLILIIPLEFLANFITRPITLTLRLFANLFAGHLLVLIFVAGGSWLLTYTKDNFVYNVAGGVTLLVSFGVFALELFIGFLQAYIFTILTTQYVASAHAEQH